VQRTIKTEGEQVAKVNNTESKVEALTAGIIEELGYELVDVEFVKEGQNWYLRFYLDKEGGISIDDCEKASRRIEKLLDEKDVIEQAYILEVSSPGLDRQLKKDKDFVKYAGSVVDVKLYKAVDGNKEFQGTLKGLEGSMVTIEDENGNELSFDRKDIAVIKLAVIF